MKRKTVIAIGVATLIVGLYGNGVPAKEGHTAAQLKKYFCFNAGPSNWMHCLNPRLLGNPSVSVKVFSENGSQFMGTEQLIRYDIYSGQPCPQDGLDQWDFLGEPPYFACHHFHTGHH